MKLLRAALPALSVILAAGAAQAADDWEFSVSPFIWGPGLVGDGQVPPDGPSADIDITFKDILSHITGAFMGTAEARYGRFGVLGDVAFVKFTVKPDVELGGTPVINSKVAVSTNATTIAGFGRVYESDRGSIDLLAGARYSDFKLKAGISQPGQPGKTSENEINNWQPMIGIRGDVRSGENWTLAAYGDYAGLGDGNLKTWQAQATASYGFNEHSSLYGGVRVYNLEVRGRKVDSNLTMAGPIFGYRYTF